MQPNNYLLNIPNPQQDVMQSVAGAMSLKGMMEQRKMNQEAHAQDMQFGRMKQDMMQMRMDEAERQRQAAIAAAAAQKKHQAALSSAINDIASDPYNTEKLFKYRTQFQELGGLDKALEGLDTSKKDDLAVMSTTVKSALMAGDMETVNAEFDRRIEAATAAGDEQTVAGLEANKKLINVNPTVGLGIVSNLQASLLGADKLAETNKGLAEAEKIRAEASLTRQQANKAGIEARKMISGSPIELTKDGEKLVNAAVTSAMKNNVMSDQYLKIADQIDSNMTEGGMSAKGKEYFKKVWGDEDQVTALKQEYSRLRNTAALDMLPPGVASDKDIEIAMSGFPDTNANPELISSFMRGMSKIQKFTAKVENEKADWVTKVGNLGSSTRPIKIKGKVIEPGTRFTEYVSEKYGTAPTSSESATSPQAKRLPTYEEARAKAPNLTQEQYDAWVASKAK